MTDLAYNTDKRPDSGFTNPMLGMWLFLASEVMLFASLLSAYALLRMGALTWPSGTERLHTGLGAINTVILVASSVVLVAALRAARRQQPSSRLLLFATAVMGFVFIAIKLSEYGSLFAEGYLPRTDIFSALYFTLTGVHVLHLVGGLGVLLHLAGPGFKDLEARPLVFAQRVQLTSIYWNFVDAVWIVLFVLLYLT